jgi:hypothetical protein
MSSIEDKLMRHDSDSFFTAEDKHNHVQFYWVEKPHNFNIEKGLEPKALRLPYILIVSPGQNKSEVRRPVQEKDKRTYKDAWKAFEANKEASLDGTPIEMLPGITEHQIKHYRYLNIYTTQQLASVSDGNLQNLGTGAMAARENARKFNEMQKPEISAMNEQMKKMAEQMEKMQKELDARSSKSKAA